ncbi:hypothetical protein TNCV_845601 [Trichonephila clavipes]|nr:hypothetical protein TNCV_845601 [Trichonephila clavipes]
MDFGVGLHPNHRLTRQCESQWENFWLKILKTGCWACMSIAVVRLQLDYVEKHLDRYQMWVNRQKSS